MSRNKSRCTVMDQDPGSWEANAQHMLERCPYTVWQRPGGGPVDLKATLVVTFQTMQMRLEGHPMYERAQRAEGVFTGGEQQAD